MSEHFTVRIEHHVSDYESPFVVQYVADDLAAATTEALHAGIVCGAVSELLCKSVGLMDEYSHDAEFAENVNAASEYEAMTLACARYLEAINLYRKGLANE